MTKYLLLQQHLRSLAQDEWRASFREIETIIGFALPESARRHKAWWSNQQDEATHRHAKCWMQTGWRTEEIDLSSEQVRFRRKGKAATTACEWDGEEKLAGTLYLHWKPLGRIQLHADGKLVFPKIDVMPGLYRIRIRQKGCKEKRYVGESDNLRRRFQNYRTPGGNQKTSIRINGLLKQALVQGADISLSISTESAQLKLCGQKLQADFSRKAVRRLFEHFAQVTEHDIPVESLNR